MTKQGNLSNSATWHCNSRDGFVAQGTYSVIAVKSQ